MSKKHETRRAEIRAATIKGKPGVTLKVIAPAVVDDYGSVWEPGAFDESIDARMPTLCWAHDWGEPLGPAVEHRKAADGTPEIDFVFSDFDAVPMARRAHAQVQDGTIADCSVGFANAKRRDPTDAERTRWPGVTEIIEKAELDEVSLVLRGAVPGAKVLSVRSTGGRVSEDEWIKVAKKLAAGELTEDEAKAALQLVATEAEGPGTLTAKEIADAEVVDLTELEAEADAALASIGRSRR